MREFHRVCETPVRHHPPQGGGPRLREEEPRNVGRPINAHQAPVNQGLGGWRQLRLLHPLATAPDPQLESLGDRGQCAEKLVEFAPDVLALGGREVCAGGTVRCHHGRDHSTPGSPSEARTW
jgi:hypothetical protein